MGLRKVAVFCCLFSFASAWAAPAAKSHDTMIFLRSLPNNSKTPEAFDKAVSRDENLLSADQSERDLSDQTVFRVVKMLHSQNINVGSLTSKIISVQNPDESTLYYTYVYAETKKQICRITLVDPIQSSDQREEYRTEHRPDIIDCRVK